MNFSISNLSSASRAEWRSLSSERDPELRAEGLLSLAGRLEARGNEAQAGLIYENLISQAGSGIGESQRRRARERLEGLMGGGNFGTRAENFLRHFVRQSTDPAALLAMGVGGAAFRVVRLGALARFSASPASFLSRGFGARLFSGLGALGAESLAFPLAGRLANVTLGRTQDWSGGALGREWAAGALMLTALRGSGVAMNFAARRWGAQGPTSTWFLSQGSMLGGILLAQHLEGRAGLGPERSGNSSLADAFSTLLHFNLAARLSRAAFGHGFTRWERSLDAQAQALAEAPLPRVQAPLLPFEPLYSSAIEPGRPELLSEGSTAEPKPSRFPLTLYRDYRYPSGEGGSPTPRVSYPREWRDWWRQWRLRLQVVDSKLPIAELMEKRMPLREANRIWRMQIEDFAKLVGASVEVHAPDRLLKPIDRGFLPRDPAFLRAAEALVGEGSEVYELRLPYSSIRFGEATEAGDYANLHSVLQEIETGFGNQLFLSYKSEGRTLARLPSLELWDALNAVRFGENAHRMIPVDGLIPRDAVMALRQNLLAPLGLTRQAARIQEIQGKAHPFFFTLHDAFHASISSTLPAAIARMSGRIYWQAKRSLPASDLKEEMLNRISDLDPGSEYRGDSREFWNFTLAHYWKSFQADANRDDFIENRLRIYPEFLHRYQSIILKTPPQNPADAQALAHVSDLLRENSSRLASILSQVLRK